MSDYLHVVYSQNQYWGHPLRRELEAKASLRERDKKWRASSLSDLTFSISTRLGSLQEIVHLTDQALLIIDADLGAEPNLAGLAARGYGHNFEDVTAVRRVLVLIAMFAAEAESLFENLVEFYRAFMKHYFDQSVSLSEVQAKIIGFTRSAQWRTDLNNVRNQTRHRFAPWLAFEDKGAAVKPRWEPVLVHDWRPERLNSRTSTSLASFRDIKAALAHAAHAVQMDLIHQIQAIP